MQFIREEKKNMYDSTYIYRVHTGPNATIAKEYLINQEVNDERLYIIVETPEGNYCKDIQGMYKEE